MASPSSQKAADRPISFVLTNDQTGETKAVPLVIRPEDLRRSEATLMVPVQTFDGAFIDDFGPGLTQIQISGHTGWRGGQTEDGAAAFERLHGTIWKEWHSARQAAVDAGQPADVVKLIFSDALDNITVVVAPGTFNLRRNRSRPLLMMYEIGLTVISERIDAPLTDKLDFSPESSADKVIAGAASLKSSVGKITAAAANVRSFIDTNLAGPVKGLLNVSTAAFDKVLSVVEPARGLITQQTAQLVGIAGDLALVGRNALYTYNAVAGLPAAASHQVSQVAASYENAFCVLRNAFRQVREYQDFDGIYGASACSSTVGGSPLSPYVGLNPWEHILPTVTLSAAVSPEARAHIEVLKAMDPVLRPMGASELSSRLVAIAGGVSI